LVIFIWISLLKLIETRMNLQRIQVDIFLELCHRDLSTLSGDTG